MVKIKRVYDPESNSDGKRVLIDRLWPRGIKKEELRIDEWLKEIAPSDELRRWFAHDPAKWAEFKERYRRELREKAALIDSLTRQAKHGTLTLLYSAKDEKHNNAVALQEMIQGGKDFSSTRR
ncbi:MAG: DUF488 domain-containing protein [Deltaproteobacteria bacterium]|nr:DUF488 domain-containing protein [Deltaproteobacteria bacterium]